MDDRQQTSARSVRRSGRTAFVFADGGSLGAVQVGMLQALTEHGVQPDLVVGASAGAINAAFFAGYPTRDGADALDGLWRGVKRRDVMSMGLRDILRMAVRRDHLVEQTGRQRHPPMRTVFLSLKPEAR